jgi:hypothetical protein
MRLKFLFVGAAASVIAAAPAAAQPDRPAPVVELSGGYAAFIDDGPIAHAVVAASARWYLSGRLSVGPEITYMIGPGSDRDLFLTGNLTVDLRAPGQGPRPRIVPYVLAGAGILRHTDSFFGETYAAHEGALTAGAGVRIRATPRVSIAPEFRIGWEPHTRLGVTVGYDLGP